MICNICGNDEFIDTATRKKIRCSKCGSLERTRLFYLYFQKLSFKPDLKVLHLAPEKGLYNIFKEYFKDNYIAGDLRPSFYSFANDIKKIDLQELDQFKTGSFDLIIHIHVLNCMPGNYSYTLYHLFRMLSEKGIMLCMIPFSEDYYREDLRPLSNAERRKLMGHESIYRHFGILDANFHLGKIFDLNSDFNPLNDFNESLLEKYNIPVKKSKGLSSNSIQFLSRKDCKFSLPKII